MGATLSLTHRGSGHTMGLWWRRIPRTWEFRGDCRWSLRVGGSLRRSRRARTRALALMERACPQWSAARRCRCEGAVQGRGPYLAPSLGASSRRCVGLRPSWRCVSLLLLLLAPPLPSCFPTLEVDSATRG